MIDLNIVRSRIAVFHERNGSDCITIDDKNVYSNGAWRDTDPMGPLVDPSPDDHERLQYVCRYWTERLERARDAFDALKSKYVNHSKAAIAESHRRPPKAPEDAIRRLTDARAEVRTCQAKLKEAERQFAATPKEQRRKTQAQESTDARNAHQQFLRQLEKFEI